MFDFNMPVAAIPEDYREFLPSMATPAIDDMLNEYAEGEVEMRKMHAFLMANENRSILGHFAFGAEVYHQSSSRSSFWASDFFELFDLTRAINARQEHYWFKLFDLCSLTTVLPTEIWEQWSESFKAWRQRGGAGIPPFDRTTVYRCLSLIEAHRANFFSMRVDAIWKSLSNWHKTNWGGAFHNRFIIDWMYNDWGTTTHKDRAFMDLINACSTVITGADDPFFNSYGWLRAARADHCGEWVELMDGVLRIKAFKRGTLHCEIHPEVANRLNVALAYIHPNALPDEATLKRPRKKSGFGSADLMKTSIPRQVRNYLSGCQQKQRDDGLWQLTSTESGHILSRLSGAIKGMIDAVVAQVGGVREEKHHVFDYAPMEVIAEIVRTGEVPEKVSHQFYSTPAETALEFVEWVGLDEDAICYETSAGTGGIAKHMPLQTYCVEVDRLRAMALDKMGFEVKHADFLSLAPADLCGEADAVLMNPPFAKGAWKDHIEHAAQFLKEGGTLAAILPEGARSKLPELNGVEVVYSEPMKNRFPDASIAVVFAKWVKPGCAAPASSHNPSVSQGAATQCDLFKAA